MESFGHYERNWTEEEKIKVNFMSTGDTNNETQLVVFGGTLFTIFSKIVYKPLYCFLRKS